MNDDRGREVKVGDSVAVLFINRDRGAEMWMGTGRVVGIGRTRLAIQFPSRNGISTVGSECVRIVDEVVANPVKLE